MRRLGRILLNAFTALSALVFVATVVMWVRSYARVDIAAFGIGPRKIYLNSLNGCGAFGLSHGGGTFYIEWSEMLKPRPSSIDRVVRPLVTFELEAGSLANGDVHWVVMPYWVFGMIGATLPVARVLHRRRKRRCKAGLCRSCGYDLRATPERCPECGTIASR